MRDRCMIHLIKVECQDGNRWYLRYSTYNQIANNWGAGVKSYRYRQLLELKLPVYETMNAVYVKFDDPIEEAEFIMKYSEGIEVDTFQT